MPIYDYRCDECGTTYDVLHKVREVAEDVVCPSCGSVRATRLISAPAVNTKGRQTESAPPCGDASCCGGSCSLN
jgi:putative FmdB family regulatory protein